MKKITVSEIQMGKRDRETLLVHVNAFLNSMGNAELTAAEFAKLDIEILRNYIADMLQAAELTWQKQLLNYFRDLLPSHDDGMHTGAKDVNPMGFPNGFRSWIETFYEVSAFLALHLSKWNADDEMRKISVILQHYADQGSDVMYDLAFTWTNEFEHANKGREWDGEFFDEIEIFCKDKDSGAPADPHSYIKSHLVDREKEKELTDTVQDIHVKYAFADDNDLMFYRDKNGVLFAVVDGEWHVCTHAGEPDYSIRNKVIVEGAVTIPSVQ